MQPTCTAHRLQHSRHDALLAQYQHIRHPSVCSRSLLRATSRANRHCTPHAAPAQKSASTSANTPSSSTSRSSSHTLRIIEHQDRRQTTYSWRGGSDTTANGNSSSSSSSTSGSSVDTHTQELQHNSVNGQQGVVSPGIGGAQQRLTDSLRSLYLPAGYPQSVTDDYLSYQLFTVPAHITGWLSISLTTSSLLKAVGLNTGPVGATAAAAAIRWIVKDGIGAAGRLLVGGRLGLEFDDDPRRWRMMAEALTSTGLALEIATAVYPAQFLLLASVGNFTKAVGKGMGKPVFRVIQTHFAATGNVGAVAAKEEVWEVSAQLMGYALSVALLQTLQDTGNWQTVVGLWAVIQAVHVSCRYWALKQLRFSNLNQKRASILAHAHVRGQPLPNVAEGNQQEPMLLPVSSMQPQVVFGCSVAQAWGVETVGELEAETLQDWIRVYDKEGYLMVWREGQSFVVVKQGCDPQQVLLRALWQAAWLEAHASEIGAGSKAAGYQNLSSRVPTGHNSSSGVELLCASVEAMGQQYGEFVLQAQAAGWDTDNLVSKVGTYRLQVA